MKILFVVQNYFPSVGGTQIFFQNFAEKCIAVYNDEATVFTTNSYYGPEKKYFKKISKTIENINGVSICRFAFIRFHLYFSVLIKKVFLKGFKRIPEWYLKYLNGPWSPSLARAINKSDADVIMAGTSSYLYMNYPLKRHLYKNPKPFVFQGAVHFTGDEQVSVISKTALEAIKKSEYYLANTRYEKERLVKLGVAPETIVVAGIGLDMELYKNGDRNYYRSLFGLNENDILLGYIGRIEITKSLDILLKAFELISSAETNIHLVIAGYTNNAYAKTFEKMIERVNRQNTINIHTFYSLSQKEKVNLYHAIDIFITPSVNESFGMVFLESWSCKKPVIAMATGAISSVVTDGTDGLLCKPGDAVMLSKKMEVLINDPALRKSMGEMGYLKTASDFTLDIVTRRYRDTLQKAITKFKKARI